ncbi:GAP family protein, partial [Mycobacterium sp.]|uniref:GAP family protein n=1 Tax=Mycobacterium sp. TaxID=1785 RepID=UPI00127BC446
MWGVILWLAFIGLMDPVRLGIAALLVSRPRPMLNLLIFWLGLLTAGLGITVAALFVLRDFMLPVIQVMHAAGTYMTAPPARITLGLLALSAAGMLVFRPSARFAGPAATPALQPKRPTVFSRLTWPAVLNGGSLRTAFLAGLGTATPPVEYGGAIIAISACEAGAGTQLCAALVFIFASYAVVELPLLSFLISPAQTCVVVT